MYVGAAGFGIHILPQLAKQMLNTIPLKTEVINRVGLLPLESLWSHRIRHDKEGHEWSFFKTFFKFI